MSLDHENPDVFFNGKTSFDYNAEWLSTVRGRAGVALDDFAVYATGGLAVGEVNLRLTDTFVITETAKASDVQYGWTVGGGVGMMLAEHWTAKAEYLYVDLEDSSVALPILGERATVENIFHIGRVGLGYKF